MPKHLSRFSLDGVGLHTGLDCKVVVEQGRPGSGVLFRSGGREIPARSDSISISSRRSTVLSFGGASVGTVEHLLAAIAAMGLTDLVVEVQGPEIPILDGSSLPWIEALAGAGAERCARFVEIDREIRVDLDGASARLSPVARSGEPLIRATIDFGRKEPGRQQAEFNPLTGDFASELAPARTFALASEVDVILEAGLGKGGGLHNALVIGDSGPLNPEGMRFDDEPARHKLLDAVGDLYLLGGLPWAKIDLAMPGHRLLHELVRRAAQSVSCEFAV